jgi:DNA-directed RNA polymerase subunit RPC12/RpoP
MKYEVGLIHKQKYKCNQCGNEYYFVVIDDKVVCDLCLAKGKKVEVVRR